VEQKEIIDSIKAKVGTSLTLAEIPKLRCIHRHVIEEHPMCFLNGDIKWPTDKAFEKYNDVPWFMWPGHKIGYLDIETSGLNVNFGTMLSWAIKEKGGGIHYDVITKDDIFDRNIRDLKLVTSLLEELKKYSIVVTYYGCVTPGHKILTKDLRWVNVETLKPGDELLSFEDNPSKRSRQYTESVVMNNVPIVKDVFEITLSNGQKLVATGDHPWLVKRQRVWCWRKTSELLNKGQVTKLDKIIDVWEESNSRESGYLAGFFDSEGGVYQVNRKDRDGEYTFSVWASQNEESNGNIIDEVVRAARSEGFELLVHSYDKEHPRQMSIGVGGSKQEKLKFLGKIRPQKLKKLDVNILGEIGREDSIEIVSIIPLGKQVVCGLETSSKTYIVDGFGSHNTNFDVPFIRAKALHYNLEGLEYGSAFHLDLYFTIKSKFALSRKSLAVATEYFGIPGKTPIEYSVWYDAQFGEPEELAIVLEHNIADVEITEKLHDKITPYRKWLRKSV